MTAPSNVDQRRQARGTSNPCRSDAEISRAAGDDEVLVSSTVKDLVAGSGLEFAERGTHELQGIPGTWQLFAAAP